MKQMNAYSKWNKKWQVYLYRHRPTLQINSSIYRPIYSPKHPVQQIMPVSDLLDKFIFSNLDEFAWQLKTKCCPRTHSLIVQWQYLEMHCCIPNSDVSVATCVRTRHIEWQTGDPRDRRHRWWQRVCVCVVDWRSVTTYEARHVQPDTMKTPRRRRRRPTCRQSDERSVAFDDARAHTTVRVGVARNFRPCWVHRPSCRSAWGTEILYSEIQERSPAMVAWESMSRGTGSFLAIFTAWRMHAYAQYVLWPGAGRSVTDRPSRNSRADRSCF